VRYRGELHDPNELSMTISIGGLSFLIAFMLRRKTTARMLLGTFASVLVVWTVILSKSRGGMVVALAVPGVYFIKRFGIRGALVAAAAAVPILAIGIGGRSGHAAAVSTELRYEAWAAGLDMFQRAPLFGVGVRQFGEHHFMTAHNSYVLALAELGFVGLVLFVMLIYTSIKTVFVGLWRLEHVPGAQVARVWGMALLASLLGLAFQINTLSFAYHSVLWIFVGLAGAWTSAVRHHMPEFTVKIGLRDVAGVVVASAIYTLVVLPIFLRWKHAL
jgi:O-antigen ligase